MDNERKTARRKKSNLKTVDGKEAADIQRHICEGCKKAPSNVYLGKKLMYLCTNCYNALLIHERGKEISETLEKRYSMLKLIKIP